MFSARRRRIAFAAVTAVLVLSASACGGGDDSADTTATTAGADTTSGGADTTSGGADTTSGGADTTAGPDETTDTSSEPDETTETSSDPDDTTATSGASVELLDAGAEEGRVQLPGTATVGQTGTGEATIVADVAGAGVDVSIELTLGYEAEIVEADDDGYVAETTITQAEFVDAPAEVDESTLEPIVGVRYRQSFAADGTPGEIEIANEDELSSEQLDAFEQFGSELRSAAVAFPAEPVGEGARWTSTTAIQSQGLELELTYEYEVTSLDGTDYVIAVTYDQPIDGEMEQSGQTIATSGNVSGEGTVQGSTENPLQNTTELTQDFALDLESGGQTVELQMDIQVLLETAAD